MSTSTRRPARNQPLPPDEIEKLNTLKGFNLYRHVFSLFSVGWTLRAIGEAFTPPKARSTVQSWVEKGRETPLIATDTVPTPVLATPPAYIRMKPVSPGILPAELAKIKDLAPIARKFRSGMSPLHKAALANEELTVVCRDLAARNVTITELAAAAGVTYRAMSKRLDRI